MEKPLAEKDLVEAILELRAEADRRLMRNKYYVAIKKLDELLEAIGPLEEREQRATDGDAGRAAEVAAPLHETGDSVTDHAYTEAVSEPPTAFAAPGDEAGYAQELDEGAAELFEEPRYEPVRTEQEVSVLDVTDEAPAAAAAAPIRPTADAAE